ncbi:hypothetical protein DIPPA_27962 [Diplonema papillatum]|nr:hypothetical protein DIPPA_27962 [Diplonema papillatum]
MAASDAQAFTTTAEERAEAAKMREGGASSGAGGIEGMPAVELGHGVQKYVLIKAGGQHLVRGNPMADYHKDAAAGAVYELRKRGVSFEVLGGGRIEYVPGQTAKIYGFSYGFPWKDGQFRHDVTAEVIAKHLPGVRTTVSNDGY